MLKTQEMFYSVSEKQKETRKETVKYNPTEALKSLDGITRKRLYEMMSKGDISYQKEGNKRMIDTAELARVFPNNFKNPDTKKTFLETDKKQKETLETDLENMLLKQKIEALEKENSLLRADKEDYKNRLTQEGEERRKMTMILTDMRPTPPQKPVENRKKFLGIF